MKEKYSIDDPEEWVDVANYKGLYRISSLGHIGRIVAGKYRPLKPFDSKKGYLYVNLCSNAVSTAFSFHRLVAIHFIDNPHLLPQVNHLDLNRKNPAAYNLEWSSQLDNYLHAVNNNSKIGFKKAIPEATVLGIVRMMESGLSTVAICKEMNLSDNIVRGIVDGRNWTRITNLSLTKNRAKRYIL